MVKDFGPEAEQAVNGTTQAAFSNYRVRFIKPDVAVVDALLRAAQSRDIRVYARMSPDIQWIDPKLLERVS